MAESGDIVHSGQHIEKTTEETDLAFNEIQDIKIKHRSKPKQTDVPQTLLCDLCTKRLNNVALYLCYMCEAYLCDGCYLKHKNHECIRLESEESERRGKGHSLMMGLRSEGMRETEFDKEKIRVREQVNVLDLQDSDSKTCYITGLCSFGDTGWVAVDNNNKCLNIFDNISNRSTLLRRIKFEPSPWDATEIPINHESTNQESATGLATGVSGAVRTDNNMDKHCLIAITFPRIEQIWILDINKTPAIKTRTIELLKECWKIECNGNNMFVLCEDAFEARFSIIVLSLAGVRLKNIDLHIPNLDNEYSDFVVYNDRAYVTCGLNDEVWCIDLVKREIISKLTINGFWPTGISVDTNNNNIYVCGLGDDKLYKLSPNMSGFEALGLNTDCADTLYRMCFNNNSLFVSHLSALRNTVTVLQLT